MHGLKPMSHYRFREQVALAWLDSDRHWPTRYSKRPRTHKKQPSEAIIESQSSRSVSSLSSCQTRSTRTKSNSTPKRKACTSINQAALDKGSFDSRLILNDEKTHLPIVPSSGHSDCQIHKWAGKRTRKQVAYTVQIVMFAFVSGAIRYSTLFWICDELRLILNMIRRCWRTLIYYHRCLFFIVSYIFKSIKN